MKNLETLFRRGLPPTVFLPLAKGAAGCVLAVALGLLLLPRGASGEPDDLDPARPQLGNQGEIFVLQFSPGNRRLTVDLAGKPAAILDLADIEVSGRALFESGEEKALRLKSVDRYFEILDPPIHVPAQLEFTVKDHRRKKTQTVRFKTKPPP
jgi:hypothetical protein